MRRCRASLSCLTIGATIALGGCCRPAAMPQPSAPQRVTTGDLSEHPAIGVLGVPLGTVVEVRATVVSGRETRRYVDKGRYLLRVSEVAGRALPGRPLLHIERAPGVSVLPAREGEEFVVKRGEPATTDRAAIEAAILGREYRLMVYETGEYVGIPDNLPDGLTWGPDVAFSFRTHLVIVGRW